MQGIKIQLDPNSVKQTKKQFNNLLKEFQDKAKSNPIVFNIAGFNKVADQLGKAEKQIAQTKTRIENIFEGTSFSNDMIDKMGFNEIQDRVFEIMQSVDKLAKYKINFDEQGNIKSAFITYRDELNNIVQETMGWSETQKKVNDEIIKTRTFKTTGFSYSDDITGTINDKQALNYSKAKSEINIIKNIQMDLLKIDKEDTLTRDRKVKQLKEHQNILREILKSQVELNTGEKESALNTEQVLKLNEALKENARQIIDLKVKQRDAQSRTTSTTSSGQRNLGEEVHFNKPINFNASRKELDAYAKAVGGVSAEWTKLTPKIDAAGNKIKEVSIRVQEAGDKWHNYTMTLDEASGKLYKVDRGLSDVNHMHLGFISSIKLAIERTMQWASAMTIFYGTIQQLKSAVQYVTQMDDAMVDLTKVVDFSSSQMDNMRLSAMELSKQLGKSSKDIMMGFAETGRAIKDPESIKEFTRVATLAANVTDLTVEQASKSLSTAMVSFRLNANDMLTVLNQINSLQNNFKVTASSLMEGIAGVGAVAQSTGTKINELEGYLTAIISTMGIDGSEAGTALKGIMSRIFRVGEDGVEDAGKSEALLNSLGISIRKSATEYKSFSQIITDIADKYKSLNSVQQQQLSQTISGQHHYTKFTALMNSFDIAQQAITKTYESQNSVLDENAKYLNSVTGRVQVFKASLEELYANIISSDAVKSLVNQGIKLIEVLNIIATTSRGSVLGFVAFSTAVILIVKNLSTLKAGFVAINIIMSNFMIIAQKAGVIAAFGESFGMLGTAIKGVSMALLANPWTWAIAAIGAATLAVIKHVKHQRDLKNQTDELTTSYKSLTSAIQENNVETMKSETARLQDQEKKMSDLLARQAELQKQLSDTSIDFELKGSKNLGLHSELSRITKEIEEQKKVMQDAGITYDEYTRKIQDLAIAQNRLEINQTIDNIEKQTQSRIAEKDKVIDLINEYMMLNEVKGRTAEQDARMSLLTQQLHALYGDLNVIQAANGQVQLENIGVLQSKIGLLSAEKQTIQNMATAEIDAAKKRASVTVSLTTLTIEQAKKRVESMQQELKAMMALMTASIQADEGIDPDMFGRYQKMKAELQQWLDAIQSAEDALSRIGTGSGSIPTPSGGGGYIPPNNDADKANNELERAQEEAYRILEEMSSKIKELYKRQYEEEKQALQKKLDQYEEYIDSKQKLLDEEFESQDNTKEINKKNSEKQAILDQINQLSLDTSREAKARIEELKKELASKQEEIDDFMTDLEREARRENLEQERDAYREQIEKAMEELNEKYSDENLEKLAKAALISGQITDINGNLISLSDGLLDFINSTGEGLGVLGEKLKTELLEKLEKALKLIGQLNSNGTIDPNVAKNIVGVNGSYSNGGIHTSTSLAMLHASQSDPELILNSSQISNVAKWLFDLAKNPPTQQLFVPKNPNFQPIQSSSNVNLNFDSLINVEGNVDRNVMPSLQDLTNRVCEQITNTMRMQGLVRR